MQNIFVEFLPPWIETGLQPAFYDKESGTVLQQVARMYAKVNYLVEMFNRFSKDTTDYVNEFVDDTNAEIQRFEHDTTETVNDYIARFVALKDFVDDYFDNLDVQQEINNKLDDMLEQGTLQEIIDTYVQTNVTWTFDTVSDMAAATNLISGSYAQTLGHTSLNDGGGAIYYITDTADSDEWQESVGSGLYANLVGPLSPENTGLPVDTLINNWNTKKELKFGVEKTYTITSAITITDVKTYDFHGSTIIYDGGSNIEDMINIGYDHHGAGVVMRMYAGIKNVNLDGNSKVNTCLHISGGKSLLFENIKINNPLQYGLLADNSVGQCWELSLNNITSDARNNTADHQAYSAIKINNVTDSNFNKLYPVNGSVAWMDTNSSMCAFTNVHGYKYPDTNDYIQTQGFKFAGNRNSYTNLIVDTADTIGITELGGYNNFKSICLYMKADGKGIIDSDNNNYDGITVHRPLACVIEKALGGTYLHVSGIVCEKQSGANPATDITFLNSKLPKMFSYDWSARCVTPLKNSFLFTGTCNSAAPSATITFPIETDNNGYMVNVMLTKAMPYSITNRATTGFDLSFNADDITALGSVGYFVRVVPTNGSN